MNIIDPRIRKVVTIDGATFTIRPLNGADRIAVGSAIKGEMLAEIARRGIVDAVGLPFDWGKVIFADDLPPDAIAKVADEIMRISSLSGDDRKNSESGRESSLGNSLTPGAK